mgnify:CR=1 FL=1
MQGKISVTVMAEMSPLSLYPHLTLVTCIPIKPQKAELTADVALVDREVFSHPLAQQLLVYTECSLFERDAVLQLE